MEENQVEEMSFEFKFANTQFVGRSNREKDFQITTAPMSHFLLFKLRFKYSCLAFYFLGDQL